MIYWIQVVVQAWEHMFSDKTLVQIKAPGKSRAEMPCFFHAENEVRTIEYLHGPYGKNTGGVKTIDPI